VPDEPTAPAGSRAARRLLLAAALVSEPVVALPAP